MTVLTTLKDAVSTVSTDLGNLIESPFSSLIVAILASKFGVSSADLSGLVTAISSDVASATSAITSLVAEHQQAIAAASTANNASA